MSVEEIPLFNQSTSYRYTMAISGINYLVDMTYMARQDALYMSIYEVDGTPLRTGMRVVINWPINARDTLDPDGVFVAISRRLGDITRADMLAENFKILYVSGIDLILPPDTSGDPIKAIRQL